MSAKGSNLGALGDRKSWKAVLRGGPREWTSDDLEAAQIEANEIPPGPGIPSAGERCGETPGQHLRALRAVFQKSVAKEEAEDRRGLVLAANPRRSPGSAEWKFTGCSSRAAVFRYRGGLFRYQ